MQKLYVRLECRAIDKLVALAERERRTPQEQAAYMLERALEMAEGDREAAGRHEARVC